MGRGDQSVVTYGRHRNRVISSDIWLSDGEKGRQHVFSTSSDFDSSKHLSLSHCSNTSHNRSLNLSSNSTDNSLFQTKSTRALRRNKNKKDDEKENRPGDYRHRRVAQLSKYKDVSSSSNSSSDSGQPATRRALRDKNKTENKPKAPKGKPLNKTCNKRKRPVKKTEEKKDDWKVESLINFSDFDNYSLVVSDSSLNRQAGPQEKNHIHNVETSTPVAKRTRHKESPLNKLRNPNVSGILHVESPGSSVSFSPSESTHSNPISRDRTSLSSVTSSPSIISSTKSPSVTERCDKSDGHIHSPEDARLLLDRLSDSFISMHVSKHRGKRGDSTFNNSYSLFSFSEKPTSPMVGGKRNTPVSKLAGNSRTSKFCSVNSSLEASKVSTSSCSEEDEDEDYVKKCESLDALLEEEEDCEEEEEHVSCLSILEEEEDEGSEEEEEEGSEEESWEEEKASNSLSILLEEDEESEEEEDEEWESEEENESEEGENDLEDLEVSSVCISSSSCSTLYMLNDDDGKASIEPERLSSSFVAEQEEEEESSSEYKSTNRFSDCLSENCTSDGTGNFYTANEGILTGQDSSVEDKSRCQENNQTDGMKSDSLRKSFRLMLTPVRKKKSLVPVSARNKILAACEQTAPISFNQCIPNSVMKKCVKIGEGVYGEVFRIIRGGDSKAVKIIPIEGDFPVNDEPQKKYEEMIPEVVIAKELSDLRHSQISGTSNFCEVNSVSLVQGKYPDSLLKQWDIFQNTKCSENDRPDMFNDKQLFIVFEFADCGKALDSFEFTTMQQARSVITQVCFALAVAEEALQFEHRDLHWGNVLVRPTTAEFVEFRVTGKLFSVPSMGVEANIIDYTLSRLRKDSCTVYTDLSKDELLFQGKGDYQFDIYRKMREENSDDWEMFMPHSNVCWLHYLTDKLVYTKKYPSQSSRQNREILRQFRQFLSEILDCQSACELAINSMFLNS